MQQVGSYRGQTGRRFDGVHHPREISRGSRREGNFVPRVALGESFAHGNQSIMRRKPVDLPPFAIASFDLVEKPGRLFARKHHADITGRNPRRPHGVKFVALRKRRALVEGAIRSAYAGAEQRRRFGDEDAMQSTVSVVGEPPMGHAALLRLATADDDAATIGTGRRIYALPQLRQRKPPRFLPKRCVVKLSLRNVTAAHSPKHLGSVRVFFNRSFIEALNRDLEVQPRNLQILALLSHVTPMMARAPAGLPSDDAPIARK